MADEMTPDPATTEATTDPSTEQEVARDRSAPDATVDQVEGPVEGPVEAPGADPDDDEDGRVDPQLVALSIVLWIVAVAIFAYRWDDMRVDYHLGNLREAIHTERRLDPEAVNALLALADDGVLEHLRAELADPAQRDQLYRVAVLRVAGQLAGDDALGLVLHHARDYDANVRANAYSILGRRAADAAAPPADAMRTQVLELLRAAADGDPTPFARAHAAAQHAQLGGPHAAWPAIRLVRALDAELAPVIGPMLVGALRKASGLTAEALPHDATKPAADEQLRAWEAWFREAGGVVPPGESLDEVRAREAEQQASGATGADAAGADGAEAPGADGAEAPGADGAEAPGADGAGAPAEAPASTDPEAAPATAETGGSE